jgi:transcriptional regulator with XRE-family HTH domain
VATRYRSRRARLAALSDSLRAQGQTWAQIATRVAREEHVNMRVGFRLAHGMSQREVAARWNDEFPTETGSASMADKVISYWETWPQSGYEPSLKSLKRLARIYQCSVGDLIDDGDFSHLDTVTLRGTPPSAVADGELIRAWKELGDDEVGRVTAQSAVGREQSAEDVFRTPDFAEIDDMNRRELLRIMSVAGTLLAMGPVHDNIDWERLDYFDGRASKLDGQTVEEFAALNKHLWRVFVLSRTKRVVFPLVRDQLDVLINNLVRADGPAAYRRLCELTSSLFQLSGEIFFDENRYTDAAHCYTLAATASKEANALDLWACALTRHAFIGVYERRFDKSAPMLELAASLARRGDGTLATRHWVAVVQAQAFAGLGDLDACQRALDVAGQVHGLRGEIQNGGWLRFDGSRLAEERGACYVQLHQPDLAEAALTDALRQNLSVRRRGSVLTDLAILGAQRRDLDRMITYADAVVEMVRQTGSGVIARKLTGLQSHLALFPNDVRIRDLNSRIATLAGNVTAR